MPVPTQPSSFNILVLDNLLATPSPRWPAIVRDFGRTVDNRKDSLEDGSGLSNARRLQGISLESGKSPYHRWTLIDATRQNLDQAEISSLICTKIHFLVVFINAGDYDPKIHQTLRFERDKVLLEKLCKASWAKDAHLLVCLEDLERLREKISQSPSEVSSATDVGTVQKAPFVEILGATIEGFRNIGQAHGTRDIQIHHLQGFSRQPTGESMLQDLVAFLQAILDA